MGPETAALALARAAAIPADTALRVFVGGAFASRLVAFPPVLALADFLLGSALLGGRLAHDASDAARFLLALALGALGTVLIVGITLGMIVAAGWFA